MAYDNDIIPAFYSLAPAIGGTVSINAWGNNQLRQGEVKRVISPNDKDSLSKMFYEYDVLVAHRVNQGVINKLYHNCYLINSFAGLADKSYFTLRASDIQDGSAKGGNGSRVLLLCLDGNENQAFIVGGMKSPKDPDKGEAKGHHLLFEFNGVLFEINDDGSWAITNKGKTDIKGEADDKRDTKGAGTKVKVEANGNFVVTTPNSQTIKVDNKANTIDIESATKINVKASQVDLDASRVNLGSAATFSNVLGEPLMAVLTQIITQVAPTLPTPWQQAALLAVVPQISTILSSTVKGQG
jgi:phage baseplate assembly protein gpV